MKKFFLISIFLATAVAYGNSQTYYYKAVETIDGNGVKSKPSGSGPHCPKTMYITFVNQKRSCYQSDEKGVKVAPKMDGLVIHYIPTFTYVDTKNGTHIYYAKATSSYMNISTDGEQFYYFSSDFSQMQYGNKSSVRVTYKRTNGPQDDYDENIPTF